MVWCIVIIVATALVSSVLTALFIYAGSARGVFRIDTTGPNTDIYRVEINDDLATLPKKRRMILKIDPNAIIGGGASQE